MEFIIALTATWFLGMFITWIWMKIIEFKKSKMPLEPVETFTPSPFVVKMFEEYGLEYGPWSNGEELWKRMAARREFNKRIMGK